MKKIIILATVVVLIGGIIVWYAFFNGAVTPVGKTIRNILPFGSGGDGEISNADQDRPVEIQPNATSSQNLPRLFRLSDVPVAGAVSFIKNGSEVVRFADRATGHIYDINPITLEKIKIANNTLPKIYEAYFKKDGSGVIYRSLKNDTDEITNTSIELIPPKGTSTDQIYTEVQTILRGDIRSLAVSDTNKIAYNLRDVPSVVLADFNGSNPKTILDVPFFEWRLEWVGQNLSLTTAGSSNVSGFAYILNPSNGSFNKLMGPITSLTTNISPDGSRMLYSFSANGTTKTLYQNISNGETDELLPVVFPAKCVWSKKTTTLVLCGSPAEGIRQNEPDLWYQGLTHYVDQIWRFNSDANLSILLADPKKDFNIDIDLINPFLSIDEDYLIFMNKNDLSLWALKLTSEDSTQ
jgi:hypothetical protein